MNEADAREYFGALTEILNDNELRWVVDQASDEIQAGKIISNEFQISKSNQFPGVRQDALFENRGEYRARKREKFNQIVPFTPQESLILLIRAIKRLVIDTYAMQRHVSGVLEVETKHTQIKPDLSFFPENGSEETFSLSRFNSQVSQEDVNRLEQLLAVLENEAENDN